jgi:DHA2 family multidrug resistance protein
MCAPISCRLANVVEPKYLMAFGLAAVAIAMWHSTSLEPECGFWVLRLDAAVSNDRSAVPLCADQHSGLFRTPSRIHGKGILSDQCRAQSRWKHRHIVGEHGTDATRAIPSIASGRIRNTVIIQLSAKRVTEFFVAQGSSLITAQGQAVGWIGQTILNQSVLISYMDVFWGCSIFALLMVPLALTVRNVKQTKETVGHD